MKVVLIVCKQGYFSYYWWDYKRDFANYVKNVKICQ